MSIRLMQEVWALDIGHAEQAVLLALADHADDFGEHLFPSQEYLAWKAGYSVRQIRRILGDLIKAHALVRVRRGAAGRSSEYRLRLEALTRKAPFHKQDRLSGIEKARTETGHDHTPKPDILDSKPDIAMSHQPPEKPSVEPPSTAARRERNIAFDALAQATAGDPAHLTKREAEKVGIALAEITQAERARLPDEPLHDAQLVGEIRRRAAAYRLAHPTWTCTPIALAAHWSEFASSAEEVGVACEACGGFRAHRDWCTDRSPDGDEEEAARRSQPEREEPRSTRDSRQPSVSPAPLAGTEAGASSRERAPDSLSGSAASREEGHVSAPGATNALAAGEGAG